MRVVALVILCACGAEPKQPFLANAPHPDNAAVAGGAAAAAAAMTLADPNASTRGKPEKPKADEEKQPIEVKEHVPESALDHLDRQPTPAVQPAAAPAPSPNKRKGPPPRVPLPSEAIRPKADENVR